MPEAQNNLGVMYSTGAGVRRDCAEGFIWFTLAASKLPPGEDRDRAVLNREVIAEFLTPDALMEAQARARNRKPGSGSVGGK